jgi:hypothetical protein
MDDRSGSMTPGDQELERRLEAYADARLSPSVESTTRVRAAVMAEAHRQAALLAADAEAGATAADETAAARATTAPKRGFWRTWRRPVVAVLIACLAVGIVAGSAFASRAGGPLYAARLWAEMVTLPSELPARAVAEAKRLQARIDEAEEASTAGDSGATEAALVAYSTIVVEAARDAAGNAIAQSTIEVTVQLQVTALTTLVGNAPAAARAAAQDALDQSNDTLRDLKSPGGSVDDHGSPANAGRGNGAQGPKGDGTDDPPSADPGTGTTDASNGKAAKPDPTARPTDKTALPGHRETSVPAQPEHQGGKPDPTPNPDPAPNMDAKGSQQVKTGQGVDPEPCDSPKPGPDAHKS